MTEINKKAYDGTLKRLNILYSNPVIGCVIPFTFIRFVKKEFLGGSLRVPRKDNLEVQNESRHLQKKRKYGAVPSMIRTSVRSSVVLNDSEPEIPSMVCSRMARAPENRTRPQVTRNRTLEGTLA